ncbi:NAD-dependent epimerase/dehydratase family protein [Hyphomicrobium sp. MC8b]|uniref:NAD-dependent epimerase/dehydratase family protein n=1 Tax=Hyphomicrobium sp. MC8b TaxID=300273 RepID=UPI00391D51D5
MVDRLVEMGHHVRCFDRTFPASFEERNRVARGFELFKGDIGSIADIELAVERCDVCFHLASTTLPKTSNEDPAFDVESNLLATVRMLAQMARAKVMRVIYASSGGTVYGIPEQIPISENHPTQPTSSYGICKLATEKYLDLFHQLHGLDYVALRIANPYGERQRLTGSQGAVAVFMGRAIRQQPIEIWGDGTVVRDYIHIDDVVEAMVRSMENTSREKIFNIGSGKGTSLLELLDVVDSVLGRKTERIFQPSRTFDVPVNILSIERANRELSWRPRISLEEGIRKLADYLHDALDGEKKS